MCRLLQEQMHIFRMLAERTGRDDALYRLTCETLRRNSGLTVLIR